MSFKTDGGPKADGYYDIDPNAPYSPHFKFDDPAAQKTSDAVAARQKSEKRQREEAFQKRQRDKAAIAFAEASASFKPKRTEPDPEEESEEELDPKAEGISEKERTRRIEAGERLRKYHEEKRQKKLEAENAPVTVPDDPAGS